MQTAENEPRASRRKTTARPFDSLAFAKRLQAGGAFTREQAEALAEEQAALIDERLATKEDIEGLRLATQKDIEALRLAVKEDIEKTKSEILKWMFGQTVFLLTSLTGIVALMIYLNKP